MVCANINGINYLEKINWLYKTKIVKDNLIILNALGFIDFFSIFELKLDLSIFFFLVKLLPNAFKMFINQ